MDYQIISKGYYSYSQSNEQIAVKQYMFALKNNRKCLLLRFTNNEDCTLNGIDFLVQELDERGNKICEQIIKSPNLNCCGNANFSVNEDIVVHDNCTDFKVIILAADFGDYKYSYKKDNISVSYVSNKQDDLDPAIKKHMGPNKKSVTAKSFKIGSLILLVTVIVVIAALGITWAQLDSFIDSTAVFTLNNIEYEFVDGSIDSGKIIIDDYKGYETNVTIPNVINGLSVVGIKEEAFANKTLTSVVIEGSITIGDRAFANCSSLKNVYLGSSSNIGYQAFYGCSSLEKIESSYIINLGSRAFEDCSSLTSIKLTGTSELTIGENAFQNCNSLKDVQINQPLVLSNGLTNLFANDFAIENLSIKSFGNTDTSNTLHKIYGKSYADQITYSLKTITIESLDSINPYFFSNFTNLESITIHNLSIASAGKHAFENCYKLTDLNFKQLTYVDDYAFKNAGIKEFDLSKLTYLGLNAFERCKDLSVDLSKYNLTTIPDYAFSSCSITNIELSNKTTTIGKYAFSYCDKVLEIALPNTVESIGLGAFEGCTSITSISVPFLGTSANCEAKLSHFAYIFGNGNSSYSDTQVNVPESLKVVSITGNISRIGNNAFYHCSNIEEIDIPSTVKSIGTLAFYDCKSLKNVSLPNMLETIENNAFASCTSLTSVYIPITVTSIGSNIFGNDTALTTITIPYIGSSKTDSYNSLNYFFGNSSQSEIPESLKSITLLDATLIPNEAFKGLTHIETITLSSNVSSIGTSAFEGCTSLVGINITANITEIKEKAFYKSGLQSITIPTNIVSIGNFAFAETKLESVNFNGQLDTIGAHAFENACINEIELPIAENVGDYAFAGNTSLTKITQVEGAKIIGKYQFYGCSSLKTVSIAESVEQIGISAFSGCNSMISISVPFIGNRDGNSDTSFAYIFGTTISAKGNDLVPATLKNVTITNATSIPQNAFYGLKNIKSITLNDGILSIGKDAFNSCLSLNLVNVPETVTTIGKDAFVSCYKLVEIINESSLAVSAPNPLNIYTSFEDYSNRSVHFTTSDGYEFYRAGSDLANEWYLVDYNHSLETLDLPSNPKGSNNTVPSYTIINYFAIDNTNIKVLTIPATINAIEANAFNGCYNIESITFNNSSSKLKTIGNYAFYNCNKITDAKFPDSLTSVGIGAFKNCVSMQIVYVPASLTNFGEEAFMYCTSLYDVYNLGSLDIELESEEYGRVAYNALLIHTSKSEPSLYDSQYGDFMFKTNGEKWILMSVVSELPDTINLQSFNSHEEGTTLYGKPFTYRVYKNIFKGKNFSNLIVSNAVTDIPANSFANCTMLKSVDFSEATNLSSIKNNLFSNCNQLESISFPQDSAIISIGNEAFNNCYYLKSVIIPSSVTSIGESAFKNCYCLETVTIPSNVTTINKSTFSNCYRLYNVELPENLTLIDSNAFEYCYGISKITLPATLNTINNDAFINCSHLYEVLNLSSLSITKGATTNGYVGRDAKQIITSASSSTINSIKTNDGLYFVYLDSKWYLYNIPGFAENGLYTFPNSIKYNSTTIDTYCIDSKAITNPYSNINKLVISNSISLISKYWYSIPYIKEGYTLYNNFEGEIYYEGTAEDFETITNKYSFGTNYTIRYKAKCVHDEIHWTYDENGEITIEINKHVIDRQESTNCDVNVKTYYKCPNCGDEYSVDEVLPHTLDENNKCTLCGYTIINSTNFNTIEEITTVTSDNITADLDSITLTPLKSGDKIVSITYTATTDTEIAFNYSITNGTDATAIYILSDGSVIKGQSITGDDETTTRSFYKALTAGHSITIKLTCNKSSLANITDRALIEGLKIRKNN